MRRQPGCVCAYKEGRMELISEFSQAAFNRIERRFRGEETPIRTHFDQLDDALGGGLGTPGLYALVAATGVGKTQLAIQLTVNAARDGVPVLYVGLEGSKPEFVARLLSLHTAIPWSAIFRGQLTDEQNRATPKLK